MHTHISVYRAVYLYIRYVYRRLVRIESHGAGAHDTRISSGLERERVFLFRGGFVACKRERASCARVHDRGGHDSITAEREGEREVSRARVLSFVLEIFIDFVDCR